ncbi:phenylacetate--CoA ligase family protein [Paraneptunicella aestuarii]|uniref:phenylacetate--CoA ligase family protein n=1 Tax=Paraneptunicella aestuarii TaxID=2831148 RepID=UPI001E42E4CF|nr:phenylacetate--CoA ligase family protein [Paraneptunicella aestuarii]UAA39451.1 phenylacetate--CoA ligase family protein [Paraneptunicella aestuarii]
MLSSSFNEVKKEIQYAYDNTVFFRKHMELAGLTPKDILEPGDLARIPPTVKKDYRKNFPAGVIASGYNLKSPYVMRFQSSGTEGDRLVSVVLSYDLARRQANCISVNPKFSSLWQPGLKLRTCRYAAPNCSDVECANPNSTMESRMLSDGTLVLPVYHDLLTTPERMVNRALDEIEEYDPHLLFIDPTHFAFLIRAMKRAGRVPHKKQGFCIMSGYTMCTQVARRQIKECFGEDVAFADMLGMSELGYLGFECPHGRQHMNVEDYHIEFIHNGRAAEPGELAELVITTLRDRLSPHIRYATGDMYRLSAEPCSCGSSAPLVRAEGRVKNALWLHDDTVVTPKELDELIGPAEWIDMYQMNQTNDDEFAFQYLRNDAWTQQQEDELVEKFQEKLKTKNISCSPTQYLPADRGGKFISCVSSVAMRDEKRKMLSWL